MASKWGDPTRAELIAFLESIYERETGSSDWHTEAEADADDHDGCGCRFDIEEPAYYLAVHYHGGAGSNLLTVSGVSEFRPGPSDTELPDDLEDENCERVNGTLLYLAGESWIKAGCPPVETPNRKA